MRKIRASTIADINTFERKGILVITNEDGTKNVFNGAVIKPHPFDKYTPDEIAAIFLTNQLLELYNQEPLTSEEMDWAVDPHGLKKRSNQTTAEELQLLSGFKVEKNITSFPN